MPHAGRRAEALRLVDQLRRRQQKTYVPAAAWIGTWRLRAGICLARTRLSSIILQLLKVYSFFDPRRRDPRFCGPAPRRRLDPTAKLNRRAGCRVPHFSRPFARSGTGHFLSNAMDRGVPHFPFPLREVKHCSGNQHLNYPEPPPCLRACVVNNPTHNSRPQTKRAAYGRPFLCNLETLKP